MNEQTIEGLRELAAKLGTTAEYLWSVLVAAQYGRALSEISLDLAGLLAVVGAVIALKRIAVDGWVDEVERFIAVIFLGVTGAIIAGMIVTTLPDTVMRFTHPEYMALRELLIRMK